MNTQWKYNSPLKTFYLVASPKGLVGIYWEKQDLPLQKEATGLLKQTAKELDEYFQGKRKSFNVPLDIQAGTPFQKKVWAELQKIPYGETISYKELAKRIKNDKAIRAVGTANGKNPLSLIVPCHRVIASDGTLGGYAGGLKVKEKLLTLEGKAL